MPQAITDQDTLVAAVKNLELTSELFEEQAGKLKYATDLEVIVRGRDYAGGKKVGPYVRLLTYEGGEAIMRQGDWGGNTLYIAVEGVLDVLIAGPSGQDIKISQVQPGACFGEMSVLAGVERNATIAVPAGNQATVLEITRPALRLLRKLPKFGQTLDNTYRVHGFGRVLADLRQVSGNPIKQESMDRLGEISKFVVYGKHHVLCEEGKPVDRIILIKSGWVRRVRGIPFDAGDIGITLGVGESIGVDFLGAGNCLGLEAGKEGGNWKYNASVMARTEVLEVPLEKLVSDPQFSDIINAFSDFSLADDKPPATIEEVPDLRVMASAEEEITTGIVDGANLLVMDMDLCVRCGNCSLACHKVHGQSRLLRRGIQITRPAKIGGRTQHVLSPQVCMHCKDPECMTGCPTGSIFRDKEGHVDIDSTTCIGCFDCSTQCPYDAISMVPRTPEAPPKVSLFTRLKRSFSLATPSVALTPAQGDDMVAIKCNLCEDTPLNPPGARRKAYSCEENCPTGALVRVNPLEYFSEIEGTLGIVFRDESHAIGRNIHKSDPLARLWHIAGGVATVALALLAAWGLSRHGYQGHIRGSWLTMRWITGLIGLAGVAGVMTYPIRKQIYRRRAGALRYWLLAHIYLGTCATVILLMHAGVHTGGFLTTVLYLVFLAVILSGLCGLASYLIAPRMLTSIEGEPLLIEDLIARRGELSASFQELQGKSEGVLREEIEQRVRREFLGMTFLFRQFSKHQELKRELAEARGRFRERAAKFETEAERALLLEAVETAATLGRVDALVFLHKTLRIWIAPHVISTSLFLALMVVHIMQAILFSLR